MLVLSKSLKYYVVYFEALTGNVVDSVTSFTSSTLWSQLWEGWSKNLLLWCEGEGVEDRENPSCSQETLGTLGKQRKWFVYFAPSLQQRGAVQQTLNTGLSQSFTTCGTSGEASPFLKLPWQNAKTVCIDTHSRVELCSPNQIRYRKYFINSEALTKCKSQVLTLFEDKCTFWRSLDSWRFNKPR